MENGVRYQTIGNSAWFTNLDHVKRHEKLPLWKHYTPKDFPTYDNYDAINVDKVLNIPVDYDGVMGVPLTFLGKYNPEQFEIVNPNLYHCNSINNSSIVLAPGADGWHVYGKRKYARVFIIRKVGI